MDVQRQNVVRHPTDTEILTIIDPNSTRENNSAMGPIIVGIMSSGMAHSVEV